ncbi:hypothetical protein [Pseudomonas sp. VB3]|uniref:hypothetical protein n=1 Tax=Pseudomonas sp. VB3 TaxID=2994641 RepID=UPI0022EC735D|nr:hypothetical protein [Pseudomonas sp. VB3]
MLFWEWERLESYIENNRFSVSDPGKLLSPVRSVRVWRDHDLRLVMEAKSAQHSATLMERGHPPGTVRVNEDSVEFLSPGGSTACAFGVEIRKSNTNSNYQHGTQETTQTCNLSHFEATTSAQGSVNYTFDWVANIEQEYYIWPDGVEDSTKEVSSRFFGFSDDPLTLTATSTKDNLARNCIDINIGDFRVILGATKLENEFSKTKPGYILYIGEPDEETRKRIRDSLSFTLGFPIVYLGYAQFNDKQELLYFKAMNGYSMNGRAFSVPAMAPAPVCAPPSSNMLNKAMVAQVANSFFSNYNNYGLSSLNWVYWHAVTAPVHMAAAYFGAAIETIQKKYIDNEGERFNNLIIPKSEYRALRKTILEALHSFNFTQEEEKTFRAKLDNGNSVSLKVRSQRFFEHLNLNMGSAETNAWQRRNDAAHGNELADGDYISLIRDTKLLKLTLHRIVLKVTGASNEYHDYYTINYPIRNIKSGVCD